MKRMFFAILALCFCLALQALPITAATSENLLINPSFEDGLNGWVDPDGKWSTVKSEGSRYQPQDGEYFAWPTEANRENTFIYQDVSLSGYKAGDSVVVSIMVCNYDQSPHDMGRVELQFLSSSGSVLQSYVQDQRNPYWNQQNIIAPVPVGATKARLMLHAIWYVGGDVDAYYDAASLIATTEQYQLVYITEQDSKETAKSGDVLQLIADNGVSQNPADYEWSSSYNSVATVDGSGRVQFSADAADGVVFYAKDKKSGVVGTYRVNSDIANLVAEKPNPAATEPEPEPTAPEPADELKESVSLEVTIRDFLGDQILFDNYEVSLAHRTGLVKDELGGDQKPAFHAQIWFDTWPGTTQTMLDALFNDAVGLNMTTTKQLVLTNDDKGYYVVDSNQMNGGYFPIDDELFGNEGHSHNYHFSLEAHAEFNYQGFEEFEFSGDDDVWVYIDGKLVIDIGGVHGAIRRSISLPELVADGLLDIEPGDVVDFDFFFMERRRAQSNLYIRTNIDFRHKPLAAQPVSTPPIIASDWAKSDIEKAEEMGLIPDVLQGADMTRPITRLEFASVIVKVSENLSGTKLLPAVINPFTDTSDIEVLKAYNASLVAGVATDLFAPDDLLNREQAAVMLTRVFKRATMPGWSLGTDGSFPLSYMKPTPFADDDRISDWAKDSVYFMAANGIIGGTGNNMFSPRAVTPAEEAENYASATREQALAIAVRMVENLS